MTIGSDFSISAGGDLRQATAFVPGTHVRYSTLALHTWVQDLADDAAPTADPQAQALAQRVLRHLA